MKCELRNCQLQYSQDVRYLYRVDFVDHEVRLYAYKITVTSALALSHTMSFSCGEDVQFQRFDKVIWTSQPEPFSRGALMISFRCTKRGTRLQRLFRSSVPGLVCVAIDPDALHAQKPVAERALKQDLAEKAKCVVTEPYIQLLPDGRFVETITPALVDWPSKREIKDHRGYDAGLNVPSGFRPVTSKDTGVLEQVVAKMGDKLLAIGKDGSPYYLKSETGLRAKRLVYR